MVGDVELDDAILDVGVELLEVVEVFHAPGHVVEADLSLLGAGSVIAGFHEGDFVGLVFVGGHEGGAAGDEVVGLEAEDVLVRFMGLFGVADVDVDVAQILGSVAHWGPPLAVWGVF